MVAVDVIDVDTEVDWEEDAVVLAVELALEITLEVALEDTVEDIVLDTVVVCVVDGDVTSQSNVPLGKLVRISSKTLATLSHSPMFLA